MAHLSRARVRQSIYGAQELGEDVQTGMAELSFCRKFFAWYNDEHYHSGIALLTPSSLHYGRAQAGAACRVDQSTCGIANQRKNGLRALECTPKPLESLTHPRLGYPSSSCIVRRARLRFTKRKSN
ncbi:MAG: hypothetical protein U0795_22895 [Pirellulales bacterium]